LHRQRDAFSPGEWEHAAKKQTAQGKCRDCTAKSEKDMWKCKGCRQIFHTSFYGRWRTTHGEHKTKLVRCNSCVYNDEQEHKREQAKTFAMVMKQDITHSTRTTTPDRRAVTSEEQHRQIAEDNAAHPTTPAKAVNLGVENTDFKPATTEATLLTIQVLCPDCNATKDISMDTLWRKDGRHRFSNVKCTACKANKRLGQWSQPNAYDSTGMVDVKTWMQNNSYDGKTFFEHESRPPAATVALFSGKSEGATNPRQTQTSKRKAQYVKDDNTKRTRGDDT
jgi:hypothetical protein